MQETNVLDETSAEDALEMASCIVQAVNQYSYSDGVEQGIRAKNAYRNSPIQPKFLFVENGSRIKLKIVSSSELIITWDTRRWSIDIAGVKEGLLADEIIRKIFGVDSLSTSFTVCCQCLRPSICQKKREGWTCKTCIDAKNPPQREIESNISFVYLIGHPDIGYKIGVSKTPERRLAQIDRAAKFPYPLQIVHLIPVCDSNVFKVESELHSCYGEVRMRGEWFRLNCHQVDEIKALFSVEQSVK